MKLRNIPLLAASAAFMAACVANPSPYPPGYYDQGYDADYYDYQGTPSYQGYYYARIIFIGNVPYYVDDNRAIRPIPPQLYDHFRHYPYQNLHRPPVFSRDREVREGYPISRIIYLNGVPYHVGDDRNAQPLPAQMQPRFRYTPNNPGNAPAYGNHPPPSGQFPVPPPGQHDNGWNNQPPPPPSGQYRGGDQYRDEHNPNGPDSGRTQQQPPVNGQPGGGRDPSANSQGRTIPSPDQHSLPLQQGQPNPGAPHPDNTNATGNGTAKAQGRDFNSEHPQASADSAKKTTGKKTDKNTGKKDNKKKPHRPEDDVQKDRDHGNANRHE